MPDGNTVFCSLSETKQEKRLTGLARHYLFVLEFYGPVNNEVMSSRSFNSGTVPRQA